MANWMENESSYRLLKRFVDEENGDILVFPKCPHCGRFVKVGQIASNGFGNVRFTDWTCSKHGQVEPDHIRD